MIEVNETPDGGVDITAKIAYEVREEWDRFIFQSVEPYLRDMTKLVISKEILARALTCFAQEHPEEFKYLQKKMAENRGNE